MIASFRSNTSNDNITECEFIKIDKPESMAKGYNEGIKQSKGEILCFIHEDTLCRQHDWFNQIVNFYRYHKGTAILGLVGTIRLSFMGGHWMAGTKYGRGKLIQFDIEQNYSIAVNKEFKDYYYEVISVDGFCFFADKKKVEKLNNGKGFDENYDAFHFYDVDICLSSREAGYKNYVLSNCLFQHLSGGECTSPDWKKAQRHYWSKWGKNDHLIDS